MKRKRVPVFMTSIVNSILSFRYSSFRPQCTENVSAYLLSQKIKYSHSGKPTNTLLLARATTNIALSNALTLTQSDTDCAQFTLCIGILFPLPSLTGISSSNVVRTSLNTSGTSAGNARVSCVRMMGKWYGLALTLSPSVYFTWIIYSACV